MSRGPEPEARIPDDPPRGSGDRDRPGLPDLPRDAPSAVPAGESADGTAPAASDGGIDRRRTASEVDLPEPSDLAALLLAIEADRRDILNRVAANFEEEIEAVAHLYWPFLLVRGQDSPGAAVFDLAGVWKQSFAYSFVPEPEKIGGTLDGAASPDEFVARVRSVVETFARNSRSETLDMEGFLPLAAPLQLELLSQTVPHADVLAHRTAMLPTRRPVGWYRDEVARMRQWLVRLESDLHSLQEFRSAAERSIGLSQAAWAQDRAALDAGALEQVIAAREKAHLEIERIQKVHHGEVLQHLEAIDGAQRAVAVGETAMATSATLAERAAARREDPAPHHVRAREARLAVRTARRTVAESKRAIEEVHARQRLAQEQALGEVAALERSNSLACATHTLVRDRLDGAASALRQCIDGQIAARQAQREALSACFLPLPAPVASKVVWLPVWVATFRSPRGTRQIVFPPLKARSRVGVGGSLKRLFGRMVVPVEPRSAQFDKEFRSTVEHAVAKDPWLAQATQELARSANLLDSPDLLPRLREGLEGLRRNEWLTPKQANEFYEGFVALADRRRLPTMETSEPRASSPSREPAPSVAREVAPLSPVTRPLEAS